MRRCIVFIDGEVGRQIAEYLATAYPADVLAFVVQQESEGAQELAERGFRVVQAADEENVLRAARASDFGVLAWWPTIIREPLLSAPREGFINIHPSILPHCRGKHTTFWTIVEQAPFGVTIHRVEAGIDSGAILAQKSLEYSWCDTGESLYLRGKVASISLFRDVYPQIRNGIAADTVQDLRRGSFHLADEIDAASQIFLESEYRADTLLNLLRARTHSGYDACWFVHEGTKYEVRIEIRESS